MTSPFPGMDLAGSQPVYEVYPAPLHLRFPSIRVPLRETDADARLDLQALIEQAYTNGRYESIDYRQAAADR